MAAAASVVLLTGVSLLWVARKPAPVLAWDRIANPNSAPLLITLEDKTQVWLHQRAVLYVNGRQARLEGEAFFDVKHAASAPFTVEAGGVKTSVLGTAFDIDAGAGGVSVSLVRGRVKVNETLLAPGEMWRGGKKARIGVEDVAAWINGDLVLNQLPLAEALVRLGDYYGVTIRADPGLCRDKTVTASYHHSEPWRQVLSHLLFIYQLSFSVAPDHTVRIIRH
jgi:ferric-dicitrate binding protein FerR (iron transport regulator)